MSTRKTTLFYALLIAVSSLAVGMVIASRLDLSPASSAQTLAAPPMNSAPVTGALDAQTFRNVAKAQSPMVVNIRTETTQRAQDLSDFFGGGGGGARTICSGGSSASPAARATAIRTSQAQGAPQPAPPRADDGGRRAPASSSARTA